LDLASALIKQVLTQQDISTWSTLRRNYLPSEYLPVYDKINSFLDRFNKLPTFEELHFDAKSKQLVQRIYIIEQVEVDTDAAMLLEFLKNDYSQRLVLEGVSKLIDHSVAFESAQETVEALQTIVVDIEKKIDLESDQENMQTIELFDPDDVISRYIKLGLNTEFDNTINYTPQDLLMFGGRRGSGKSAICANIMANLQEEGLSSLYFTVEMGQRDIIQRAVAIGAGVSISRLRHKNLTGEELIRVAKWWASRYEGGEKLFEEAYSLHVAFDAFHKKLITLPLKENRFEVIYDSQMTVGKIRSECERKIPLIKPSAIIVDYINVIKLSKTQSKKGQFDWTEQIQVANFLKNDIAMKYGVPVICPYQVDASGEARFAKGILDSADAAFTLNPHNKDDNAITFTCTKDRRNAETHFTSTMDWETLKIGPQSAEISKKEESEEDGEKPNDKPTKWSEH
jgi:replicative DNA helicase